MPSRRSLLRNLRSAHNQRVPDKILNLLCFSFWESFLRSQRLFERHAKWICRSAVLLLPFARDESFCGKEDPRFGHLPRLGESWKVPARFDPLVQVGKLRLFGDRLEKPQGLYSPLIWRRQFLQLGLEDLLDGLHHRMEKPNVRTFSQNLAFFLTCCCAAFLRFEFPSRSRVRLEGTWCSTSTPPCHSPLTRVARQWGEPKGGRAKGCPLAGCVWRFNAKRKMHLQGPWVAGRCLCRCGFAGWCNC